MRKVLVNSREGLRVEEWQHQGQDADSGAKWSIRKSTLRGGKQEGVDIVEIDNGQMRIVVCPTRGMSVLRVISHDLRLGWDSPVQEIVHPKYMDLQSRGGLGWLEGFNEWLVRCGLESAGGVGEDTFINNVGGEAKMQLTLHGKIGNIPASVVEVIVEEEPFTRIRLRGRVDERMFFGPQLELWTEISVTPNLREFRMEDQVTNRSDQPQEFQLIYHVNFGRPILEQDAQFVAPLRRVAPMNARAAEDVKSFTRYKGPTPGYVEQVYCLHPLADSSQRTLVMLRNSAGDRAVSMAYSLEQLPYLTLWKNTASEAAGYVTGIEPGTGFPNHRKFEREHGRVPKLAGGETRRFAFDVGLHATSEQVSKVAERIAAIQGKHAMQIVEQPDP